MAVYQRTRRDAQGRLVRGAWVAERTVGNKRQRLEYGSKREAQQQMARWRRGEDAPAPGALPRGQPSLADIVPAAVEATYSGMSPVYARAMEGYARKFVAWAELENGGAPVSVEWPTVHALARWRDVVVSSKPKTSGRQRMSPSAVNDHLVAVNSLLAYAHTRGLRKEPPPKVAKVKVADEHPSYLEEHEEDALVTWLMGAGQPLEADFVRASCMSGMRLNEMLKLQPEDVRPTHVVLKRQKSGKAGALAIIPEVYAILKRRLPWAIHERTLRRHIYAGVAALGWRQSPDVRLSRFRLHSLRHTTGARLRRKGVDVLKIKAVLRHSNLAHTMRYIHLEPDVDQLAISALSRVGGLPEDADRKEEKVA